MARCGCAGTTCGCLVQAGSGIQVTGTGTRVDPYIVEQIGGDIGGLLIVNDTVNFDLTLLGSGTTADPFVLSGTPNFGALATVTALSGGTTAVASTTRTLYLDHAATIASHTITLPATSDSFEKIVRVISRSAVTTLTVSGAGGATIAGAPTALAANGYFTMMLIGTTWRRIG